MDFNREDLNRIYYPIHMKAMGIFSAFVNRSLFECECGWYNGHYSKNENGDYSCDYFPIPVVSVKGVCDIEIGFEQIDVFAKLKRKQALEYSFADMKGIPFEACGVDDYLADYYNSDMTIEELYKNIKQSDEKEIGFSFIFSFEEDGERFYDFAKLLRRKEFYY